MAKVSKTLLGATLTALITGAYAQFPPKPEGVTTIQSRFHKDVTISYKEVSSLMINAVYNASLIPLLHQPGICETTPGVKSYSGYVHLPPKFLLGDWEDSQDYPINT